MRLGGEKESDVVWQFRVWHVAGGACVLRRGHQGWVRLEIAKPKIKFGANGSSTNHRTVGTLPYSLHKATLIVLDIQYACSTKKTR